MHPSRAPAGLAPVMSLDVPMQLQRLADEVIE
jgi:hypothetical protein